MRVRRLLASVITVGLIAPAAAIVSTSGTSASAAIATTVVSGNTDRPAIYSYSTVTEFGDDLAASIDVNAADGSYVDEGTITISRQLAGESTFTAIGSDTAPSMFQSDIKAEGNAIYRITYSGGPTYAPSSLDVAVQVSRKIDADTISGKRAGFKGKISPAGKVKIKVTKKVGKKYKKYKTYKSNAKGRWQIILPAPRSGRFNWKLTFVGSSRFQGTTIKGYTY